MPTVQPRTREKLSIKISEVIEQFKNGKTVMLCSGLWNDPLTHSRVAKSVEDIDSFYRWASMVEFFEFNHDTTKIYAHGYSSCDMY